MKKIRFHQRHRSLMKPRACGSFMVYLRTQMPFTQIFFRHSTDAQMKGTLTMSNTIPSFKRTKLACYLAYFTMSSVFSLPPLLFVTLREMYHISYTLLGTLVLTNFCTQLAIDLIFSIFSKHFNVGKVVKIMPIITSIGLIIYA